ncbi:hypothetical protein [Rhodococcus phenolicus]|nr:hypothetical protein [Rhodococcus phenolicus]
MNAVPHQNFMQFLSERSSKIKVSDFENVIPIEVVQGVFGGFGGQV